VSDPQVPQPSALPPAGWYPDPEDSARVRYWDGATWAAQQQTVPLDPAPTATNPPSAAATPPAYAPTAYYPAAPAAPVAPQQYARPKPTDGFAVTALVLGIAGFFVGFLSSIPAIIFGFVARSRIKKSGDNGSGFALAGIILGFIGLFIGIIIAALIALLVVAARNAGTDANGHFSVNTLQVRATALAIGLDVQSCKDAGTTYPASQVEFENCTSSSLANDTSGNGSLITGMTLNYWLRSDNSSFCVQVDKVDTTSTSSGAWDSGADNHAVRTCPESASGDAPTATLAR
jgi:hypothetical protein